MSDANPNAHITSNSIQHMFIPVLYMKWYRAEDQVRPHKSLSSERASYKSLADKLISNNYNVLSLQPERRSSRLALNLMHLWDLMESAGMSTFHEYISDAFRIRYLRRGSFVNPRRVHATFVRSTTAATAAAAIDSHFITLNNIDGARIHYYYDARRHTDAFCSVFIFGARQSGRSDRNMRRYIMGRNTHTHSHSRKETSAWPRRVSGRRMRTPYPSDAFDR